MQIVVFKYFPDPSQYVVVPCQNDKLPRKTMSDTGIGGAKPMVCKVVKFSAA